MPAFELVEPSFLQFETDQPLYNDAGGFEYLGVTLEDDRLTIDRDSGKGSSLDTASEGRNDSVHDDIPADQVPRSSSSEDGAKSGGQVLRIPRKRRRRSSSTISSNTGTICTSPGLVQNFLSSANNAILTESLLKIYHDSFENALSCWLTERTCPYSKNPDVSTTRNDGPDWNRIYHRVFRLDRLAVSIRGRRLSFNEDTAASRALNLAIFSFATQWSQSGQRYKSKYPFHRDGCDTRGQIFAGKAENDLVSKDFDRTLQISAWNEARIALHDAAEIESFRVVLAQIVFSLTQRPTEFDGEDGKPNEERDGSAFDPQAPSATPFDSTDDDLYDCESLLSKLNLTIDGDGPPVHLEQGLRLIHSLRSKVAISGTGIKRSPAHRLDAGDRATVDLLFWLGVMFDTLSSAMHKRPLVVSDEDSDIFKGVTSESNDAGCSGTTPNHDVSEGLWDDYLFTHQHKRFNGGPVRWPCPYDQAASLLCDAAPVKVLLFRKVTRIQTLLSRNVRGEKVEKALKAALDVYSHWAMLYAPFIRDCIEHHDSLPPRIQSWYICLTGHWHLATLLLADLMEIMDSSGFGIPMKSQQRVSGNLLPMFRRKNCQELSDIARCACPREDASFSNSAEFHFAVSEGALLTEPWTVVMIRAFAKAGVILLESGPSSGSDVTDDTFERAEACVQALWYLGRKSDMALAAARILGDAVKQRRKAIEEKVRDVDSFLEPGLWEDFGDVGEVLGAHCE
jgi:hypothetical protein